MRARVEHLFGFVENSMHGSIVRTIGIARAKAKIGMMNLTYNISRCVQLKIVVAIGIGMSRRERCDFVMCWYLGLYKNREGVKLVFWKIIYYICVKQRHQKNSF